MSGEVSRKKWEAGSWGLREVAVGGLPDDPVELVGLALREDGLVGTHMKKLAGLRWGKGVEGDMGFAATVGGFTPAPADHDADEG
jgi:hypothetical protein